MMPHSVTSIPAFAPVMYSTLIYCLLTSLLSPTVFCGPALDCECGLQPVTSRIVGGKRANASEYGWMAVLVENTSGRAFCGGSLINNKFILTAGHCMIKQDATTFHVVLGENDITSPSAQSVFGVSRVFTHPLFSGPPNYANDLTLVELERTVDLSARRTPVCLPRSTSAVYPTSRFGYLMVAGWGLLQEKGRQPKTLIEADVIQRSSAYCNRVYGPKFTSKHICANSVSSSVCNGDSGGPLMLRSNGKIFELGVVSYGYVCGNYRYPAAFTRTQPFLDWIFATTASAQYCAT